MAKEEKQPKVTEKEIPNDKFCIFEKRYCEYAERKGNSFQCKAPTDEAMKCR